MNYPPDSAAKPLAATPWSYPRRIEAPTPDRRYYWHYHGPDSDTVVVFRYATDLRSAEECGTVRPNPRPVNPDQGRYAGYDNQGRKVAADALIGSTAGLVAVSDYARFTSNAGYLEVAPLGPHEGQDVGGDGQASQSWCRRFVRPLGDGTSAMITVYLYVDADPADPASLRLMRQTEFMRCHDTEDPGATEEFCDYTYVTAPGEATEATAKAVCAALSPDGFTWDGRTQITYQQTS